MGQGRLLRNRAWTGGGSPAVTVQHGIWLLVALIHDPAIYVVINGVPIWGELTALLLWALLSSMTPRNFLSPEEIRIQNHTQKFPISLSILFGP